MGTFREPFDFGDLPYGAKAEVQTFKAKDNTAITKGLIYTLDQNGELITPPVNTPTGGQKGVDLTTGGAWQALATVPAGGRVQCAGFGSRIVVGISGRGNTGAAVAVPAGQAIRPGGKVYLQWQTGDTPDNPYVRTFVEGGSSGVPTTPPQAYLGRVWEMLSKDDNGIPKPASATGADMLIVEVGAA